MVCQYMHLHTEAHPTDASCATVSHALTGTEKLCYQLIFVAAQVLKTTSWCEKNSL